MKLIREMDESRKRAMELALDKIEKQFGRKEYTPEEKAEMAASKERKLIRSAEQKQKRDEFEKEDAPRREARNNELQRKVDDAAKAREEKLAGMSPEEKEEYLSREADSYAGRKPGSNWTGD
jgi:hypothetical protein